MYMHCFSLPSYIYSSYMVYYLCMLCCYHSQPINQYKCLPFRVAHEKYFVIFKQLACSVTSKQDPHAMPQVSCGQTAFSIFLCGFLCEKTEQLAGYMQRLPTSLPYRCTYTVAHIIHVNVQLQLPIQSPVMNLRPMKFSLLFLVNTTSTACMHPHQGFIIGYFIT